MKTITSLTRTYDLLLWLIPVLEKFPRSQKFLLADRIETHLLEILELLIQAAYSHSKSQLLSTINLKLESFRYLIRLCKDLQYLSLKRYEFIAQATDAIGKEIGGWLKSRTGQVKKPNETV